MCGVFCPPRLPSPVPAGAARPKPAWVNTAGRLLNGSKPQTSWYKGHGPLFKTKKGPHLRLTAWG